MQHTICENEDMTGLARRAYAVAAAGGPDLTIDSGSSAGWTRIDQDSNITGNPVSGIKKWATIATFKIDTPGDDVTLIIEGPAEVHVIDLGSA